MFNQLYHRKERIKDNIPRRKDDKVQKDFISTEQMLANSSFTMMTFHDEQFKKPAETAPSEPPPAGTKPVNPEPPVPPAK